MSLKMKKKFDCVEMKHESAKKIQKKIMNLSLEEELEYWQKRSTELKKRKQQLKAEKSGQVKT